MITLVGKVVRAGDPGRKRKRKRKRKAQAKG